MLQLSQCFSSICLETVGESTLTKSFPVMSIFMFCHLFYFDVTFPLGLFDELWTFESNTFVSVSKILLVFRGFILNASNKHTLLGCLCTSKGSSVPFAVIVSVHWLHPFLQPHTHCTVLTMQRSDVIRYIHFQVVMVTLFIFVPFLHNRPFCCPWLDSNLDHGVHPVPSLWLPYIVVGRRGGHMVDPEENITHT